MKKKDNRGRKKLADKKMRDPLWIRQSKIDKLGGLDATTNIAERAIEIMCKNGRRNS